MAAAGLRGLRRSAADVNYRCWYHVTRDRHFRVTVDTGMACHEVKKAASHFRVKLVDADQVVVECKYDGLLDPQAERVAGFFPL